MKWVLEILLSFDKGKEVLNQIKDNFSISANPSHNFYEYIVALGLFQNEVAIKGGVSVFSDIPATIRGLNDILGEKPANSIIFPSNHFEADIVFRTTENAIVFIGVKVAYPYSKKNEESPISKNLITCNPLFIQTRKGVVNLVNNLRALKIIQKAERVFEISLVVNQSFRKNEIEKVENSSFQEVQVDMSLEDYKRDLRFDKYNVRRVCCSKCLQPGHNSATCGNSKVTLDSLKEEMTKERNGVVEEILGKLQVWKYHCTSNKEDIGKFMSWLSNLLKKEN